VDKIHRILYEIAARTNSGSPMDGSRRTIAIHLIENGIQLEFVNGRKQHVRVVYQDTHYRLISVVLRRGWVEQIGREKILPLLWLRNREINLVAFTLDKRGRLIGSIEQPYKTADPAEVFYYLENLAWECDQLEYLLRGIGDMD
jgi:hypothetical protein